MAGALQQTYQSALPMFVSIGFAALAAGAIIQLASRSGVAASNEGLISDVLASRPHLAACSTRLISSSSFDKNSFRIGEALALW